MMNNLWLTPLTKTPQHKKLFSFSFILLKKKLQEKFATPKKKKQDVEINNENSCRK